LNIPDGFSYVAKNRKIFKHKSGGIVVVYKNNLKNHIKFKYLIIFSISKNAFIDEYREFSGRVCMYTHPNKRSLLNT
jgi:hypothetical protein